MKRIVVPLICLASLCLPVPGIAQHKELTAVIAKSADNTHKMPNLNAFIAINGEDVGLGYYDKIRGQTYVPLELLVDALGVRAISSPDRTTVNLIVRKGNSETTPSVASSVINAGIPALWLYATGSSTTNVYTHPSSTSQILGTLPAQTQITAVSSSGKYVQVVLQDHDSGFAELGWIPVSSIVPLRSNLIVSDDRKELAGIRSVWVDVQLDTDGDTELAGQGITQDEIKTEIELQLRKAGVVVVDAADDVGAVVLLANLTFVKGEDNNAMDIDLRLQEPAYLLRWRQATWNSSLAANGTPHLPILSTAIMCTSWNRTYVLLVGSERLADIRTKVAELVDAFLNDYLAANPPASTLK